MRLLPESEANFRLSEKHEFWLVFLLPINLMITCLHRSLICDTLSMNFFNSVELIGLLTLIRSKSGSIRSWSILKLIFSLTFLRVNLLYIDVIWAIINSIYIIFGLQFIVHTIVRCFPKSFSASEALIVSEAILLFVYSSVIRIYTAFVYGVKIDDENMILLLVQMTILLTSLFCIIIAYVRQLQHTKWLLISFVLTVVPSVIIPLSLLFKKCVICWLYCYVLSHAYVMLFWAACFAVSLLAIGRQILLKQRANTVVRKVFHILAVCVYIPGLFLCPNLLFLASGILFVLLILTETYRILNIGPMSLYLEEGFLVFADEKDMGAVALTAIYLLCGLSTPLWIDFPIEKLRLYHFAGILSVGIADSFASCIGLNYGKHHWPNCKRSVEGSLAFFISQIVTGYFLHYYLEFSIWSMMFSALIGTIVEANTKQIDNLILPLVQMLPLQIVF